MIQSLPVEVRARLRSGVTICSFGQCVEELLLNSTDASATCVAIRVDMDTFRVQVVDNGIGMGREDVELVGTRYFTSKCHSLEDLENLKSSGFRGEAVASIANVASLVEILSKTNKSTKTFTKLFQNGKAMEVCEAEVSRPSIGTTVTVCNLFYNLPVRRRCLDHVLELERTRQKVESISLMHPAISFSLRNDAAGSMLLQLPKTKDVCSRFCQIYGLSKSQKLRAVHFECGGFSMSGYISCEGHYNKNMQFLYVNKRLVLKTRLHKLIDFLLRKESIICKVKSGPPGRQVSPSRHRTGPELHGIYVINVNCHYSEYDVCIEPAKTLIEFRNWGGVLRCIEEGVKTFLNQEHLFMEPSSEDIKDFNEKNDFTLSSADIQLVAPCGKTLQETFMERCGSVVNSFELSNRTSKHVLRKTGINAKLLYGLTPDVNAEVNHQPTNKKLDVAVCGADGTGPICQEGEGAMSERFNEPISEMNEAKLEEGKDHQSTKHLPLSTESHVDVVICTEAMAEIMEQDSCAPVECLAGERVVTPSYVAAANTLGSPMDIFISDSDQEVYEGAAESPQRLPNFHLQGAEEGRCDVFKANVAPLQRCNTNESGPEHDPLQAGLCSSSLITHLAANQVKEMNQAHSSPRLFSKPGSESAQDIFGVNMSTSKQGNKVTNTSVGFSNEYDNLHSKRVDRSSDHSKYTIYERESCSRGRSMCDVTLPFQKSHPPAFSSSTRGRSASIFQHSTKQPVFSKPRACRKLSLFAQMGSLERFRRWCGKVQNPPSPLSCTQDNNNGSLIADVTHSGVSPECIINVNGSRSSIQNGGTPLTSEPKGKVTAVPLQEYDLYRSVDKPHIATEDRTLGRVYVRESPMMLSDYAQSKQSTIVTTMSLRSLAAKLSKMRGEQKETLGPERKGLVREAPLTDSNGNVTCQHHLEHEINIQGSQKLLLSCANMGSGNCSLNPKAVHCQNSYHSPDNSGTCGKVREVSNKQSMFINTAGEYISSPNLDLTIGGTKFCSDRDNEDPCNKASLSDQILKPTVVPADSLANNLNSVTGDLCSRRVNDDPNPCCSDWLQSFDASLGRTVYINKATGLSSYSAPLEESNIACTKDLTTLAVNVVSRSDLKNTAGDGESIGSLFLEWENPVFPRCPQVAVDVSSGEATNLAVKMHNILYPYRFTKEMIHSMKVLQQVDNKFIACLINTKSEEKADPDGNLLVLVDQHAAHERVRLEQLITDSYVSAPEASGRRTLLSSMVCPPMQIEVTEEHKRLLRSYQGALRDVGLGLSFPEDSTPHVLVGKVPLCFVEREANEVRRGRPPVTKAIVEEFIREEVEMLQTAGGARGILPLTVMKVLASQACHGAIKFNERLTVEECCSLMESLSWCRLPFQCAHGRPSILPLADLDHLDLQEQEVPKPNLSNLRKRFRAWQLFGKHENLTQTTNVEGAQSESCTSLS